mgnify:CR=1 FL=1
MQAVEDIDAIESLLGYSFKKKSWLEQALTHPSLAGELSYQRLEFLGDRVLGLVIATWLFADYSDEDEGLLNRRFSSLVRGETLAEMSLSLTLDKYIRMTPAAQGEDTHKKIAVLADICEAVIGAIYSDSGLIEAEKFIRTHWADLMREGPSASKDAKTMLQEWAQRRTLYLPCYSEISRTGPAHQPVFIIEASIEGYGSAQASGTSKQQAQQEAARLLLLELEK